MLTGCVESKAKNNIGQFLDHDIYVRLKPGCDINYFKDHGYCDYRVGCSICQIGDARGFKTNFLDIVSEEYFLLNDLDIIVEYNHDIDCEPELPIYYMTTDKEAVRYIFDFYKQFDRMDTRSNQTQSLINNTCHSFNITSIFRKEVVDSRGFSYVSENELVDIDEVCRVHVCCSCYKWLVCINDKLKDKFDKSSGLKFFWDDIINEDLKDIIEFKNEKDRKLFCQVIN